MAGTGRALEAAGWKHHISPYFIAAIAGTESSYGAAACRTWDPDLKRVTRFNAFGFASCGSGWHVPLFKSWAQVYTFAARFLTGKTDITSGWPRASSTYHYYGYAACSSCWGRKTAQHMSNRFHVGNTTRYH